MTPPRHIAMWNCPRSRSTALTRAFEQLEGCAILDTPFLGAYLESTRNTSAVYAHPKIDQGWTTDAQEVIAEITGPVPDGARFTFQRHISRTVLPEFGRSWLSELDSFFLIRHPKEIILSYQRVLDRFGLEPRLHPTFHDIGIDVLWGLFEEVTERRGAAPLVVHGDDVARNPGQVLPAICHALGLPYSESMLTWESDLQGSILAGSTTPEPAGQGEGAKSWNTTWYTTIANSSGFLPYSAKEEPLPDELMPLLEACMPFYERFLKHRAVFPEEARGV